MGIPSPAEATILSEIQGQVEQYKHLQKTLKIMQSNEKSSCSNRNIKYVKPQIYLNMRNPFCNVSSDSEILLKRATECIHVNSQLHTAKVHVNPNFKPQNPTVHINPNICTKPLIHVNPRIIRDIAHSNQNLQKNISATNLNSVIRSTTNINIAKTNTDNNIKQTNIKKSVYVNPTLLKKLSSSFKEKSANLKEVTERPVCSRLKFIKNTDNQRNSPKKANNSSILLLSRRKLVRVTDTAKNTSKIQGTSRYRLRKSVDSTERKCDAVMHKTKVKLLTNNTLYSTSTRSNLPKSSISRLINKSKVTKYKIDRTTLSKLKAKKSLLLKKVTNNQLKFITIGGVSYKSSKNKLVRNNCSLKRKVSLISGKNDKFNIDKRGRIGKESLNRTLEVNNKSKMRFTSNTLVKSSYKISISNKAKQRSIRILQNKMHKNNQPCLIFQRFGSCPNHENGLCPKRHDKKQVSLCRQFLQGKCFLDKCPLSHDIGPEKMPTCKYFLDGCCIKDDCPYLHVKVSANTSICIDFLQGYCAKGNKCQRRHEYLCPEFDKSGNCSKGECCPYPHKSHSLNNKKSSKYLNKTHNIKKHQATTTLTAKNNSEVTNPESRLRYYEISNSLSEDPEKKKITISDSVKQSQINEKNKSLIKKDENESEMTACHNNIKKQISINSYIPIDSS